MIPSAIVGLSGFGFLVAATGFIYYFGEYAFESLLILSILSFLLGSAIFLLFLLKSSKEIQTLVSIVIASCLVPISGMELAIQMGWYPLFNLEQRADQPKGDLRAITEVISDLRLEGKQAYPAIPPRSLLMHREENTISILGDLLPIAGVSLVTTVFCNESGEWITYESDEHGFNNPRGIWGRNKVDVLAVGDSFTHGACVSNDSNFMALIRKKFPATLSIAQSSNGPLLMLASLREYLEVAKPATVLWFYFEENDIPTDLPGERRIALLRNYLKNDFSQRLASRQNEVDGRLMGWLKKNTEHRIDFVNPVIAPGQFGTFNLTDFLLLRNLRNRLHVSIGPKPRDLKLFHNIMKIAQIEAEAADARLIVVYLPGERRFSSPVGRMFQNLLRERVLFLLKSKLSIPVIDITPVFRAHPDPQSLFIRHYTEEGNLLVAQHVLRELEIRETK